MEPSSLQEVLAGLATVRSGIDDAVAALAMARTEIGHAAEVLAETVPGRERDRITGPFAGAESRLDGVRTRLAAAAAAVDAFETKL